MKIRPLLLAIGLLAGLSSSAHAQNQGQISAVKRGQSCPDCNLFQGDFTGLERSGINLSGARLRQANLSLSVLNGARLNGADLRDVTAYGSVMSRADLRGANLGQASFVGVYLQGANLAGARLDGTNLSGSNLSGARGLTQSQLNDACGDESTVLPSGLHIATC
ncbi:pentapeptide repeat-containing protein [Brevundimonas sp.]|uniref:pentapeptide repeat-containing protein n=1 Tax=Brevundimonas sp. TaxID=1871086 RepID=UPI002896DC1A|nr:pentapeptide repeat-containing protein [Brevundimonas sp.]